MFSLITLKKLVPLHIKCINDKWMFRLSMVTLTPNFISKWTLYLFMWVGFVVKTEKRDSEEESRVCACLPLKTSSFSGEAMSRILSTALSRTLEYCALDIGCHEHFQIFIVTIACCIYSTFPIDVRTCSFSSWKVMAESNHSISEAVRKIKKTNKHKKEIEVLLKIKVSCVLLLAATVHAY